MKDLFIYFVLKNLSYISLNFYIYIYILKKLTKNIFYKLLFKL